MTQPMTNERLAELRKAHIASRIRFRGSEDYSLDDVTIDDIDFRSLLARLDAAEELIREVANSGVSFDDERLKCVELQIGRDTLAQCRSYLR